MSKSNVFSWLKQGWVNFVDPEREGRVNKFVLQMHRALSKQRHDFDFRRTSDELQVPADELSDVVSRLFEKCIERAWEDQELTETEIKSLKWIATKIGLTELEARKLIIQRAIDEFEKVLGTALADGHVDDKERMLLERVAATCDSTPAHLIQTRFQEQGESFIRNMFINCWQDGRMDTDEWQAIKSSLQIFGMSHEQFCSAIKHPAKQLVEQSLANFQSDGVISKSEEQFLEWLLANLISDQGFSEYVRDQIRESKLFSEIAEGKLPSLSPRAGVGLRAGEIVHFNGPAIYSYLKKRSKETVWERCYGEAIVTDDRLIFVSIDLSFQVLHTRALGYSQSRQGFELQCSGKGAGAYNFKKHNRLACAIWACAIGKANQTIISARDEALTRHIPRDVRQRVWQKYGGRCAECNSEQYLEFDHIVPVAKGGSNSENNVQLLCRNCNLAKSDAI